MKKSVQAFTVPTMQSLISIFSLFRSLLRLEKCGQFCLPNAKKPHSLYVDRYMVVNL